MSRLPSLNWRDPDRDAGIATVRFIHECYPDEMARNGAIATHVISLAQTAGRRLLMQPPGLLLLNVSGAEQDPLELIAIRNLGESGLEIPHYGTAAIPRSQKVAVPIVKAGKPIACDFFTERDSITNPGTVALDTMKFLIRHTTSPDRMEKLRELNKNSAIGSWVDSRNKRFGEGDLAPYADRWDSDLGLVTSSSGDIALSLARPVDFQLFRKHVMLTPQMLIRPIGYSDCCECEVKSAAVIGSFKPQELDGELVAGILEAGLPILMLPHLATESPSCLSNFHESIAVKRFSTLWRGREAGGPFHLTADLLPDPWVRQYDRILRDVAYHLPPQYSFYVLQLERELSHVCREFALSVRPQGDALFFALWHDLLAGSLHGMTTGIAALVYYGWGFYPSLAPSEVLRILREIRRNPGISRRDLQRKLRGYKAADLDSLLTSLSAQGLVVLAEKSVAPVGWEPFLRGIPSRLGFPQVPLQTAGVNKEWQEGKHRFVAESRNDLGGIPVPLGWPERGR